MNLSIDINHPGCPPETPVALTDVDTGKVVSCHKTLIEAQKARAITTGTDPTPAPGLFARIAASTPPTITW